MFYIVLGEYFPGVYAYVFFIENISIRYLSHLCEWGGSSFQVLRHI